MSYLSYQRQGKQYIYTSMLKPLRLSTMLKLQIAHDHIQSLQD